LATLTRVIEAVNPYIKTALEVTEEQMALQGKAGPSGPIISSDWWLLPPTRT
jgi:hypothetical protein